MSAHTMKALGVTRVVIGPIRSGSWSLVRKSARIHSIREKYGNGRLLGHCKRGTCGMAKRGNDRANKREYFLKRRTRELEGGEEVVEGSWTNGATMTMARDRSFGWARGWISGHHNV